MKSASAKQIRLSLETKPNDGLYTLYMSRALWLVFSVEQLVCLLLSSSICFLYL
jgi:hypothetical protein